MLWLRALFRTLVLGDFVGLYKKAYGCKSCRGRVRQKPLDMIQLSLFTDLEKESFYVRTSQKGQAFGPCSFEEIVFGRCAVDSPNERTS